MSTDDPKQRLTAIRVGEVSLVDAPANEVEFIVIKGLNSVPEAVDSKQAAQEVIKMADADKTKPTPASTSATAEETAALIKSVDSIEALTKGKKMPPELKERMEKLRATLKEFGADEDEDEDKGVKKADVIGDSDVVLRPDGVIVMKGGKQFTKERLTKLKESITGLVGMLKDVDADTFGQMFAGFNPPAPVAPAVTSAAPAPAPVAKADDAPPAWAKAMTETLEAVTKRLDNVEKGATVPKALPQDGNDKPVVKQKGLWTGVI